MQKMIDFRNPIRSSIRNLKPYQLEERSFCIKLNQNESPYDLPSELKQKWVRQFVERPWNRYPSFSTNLLKKKLSDYLALPQECLLIGNGSNELLQLLIAMVLPPQSTILIISPTFTIYQQLAKIATAKLLTINLDKNLQFPVEKIITAINSERVELCLFCSPNSPTGSVLKENDLREILQQARGLVLIDEAYYEFANTNYAGLQKSCKNLILSRTFSKAFGLAGLRIGYLIGIPEIISELNKAKLPYNLNLFSEFMAVKVLGNRELIEANVRAILDEKERLFRKLQEIKNLKVYPSQANFFMVGSNLPAKILFENLAKRGILVRDISEQHPLLKNKLRITVGTPEENAHLIELLHEIFRKKSEL